MTEQRPSFEDEESSIAPTEPTEHEQEVAEYEEGDDAGQTAGGADPRIEAGTQEDPQADLAADQGRERPEAE